MRGESVGFAIIINMVNVLQDGDVHVQRNRLAHLQTASSDPASTLSAARGRGSGGGWG